MRAGVLLRAFVPNFTETLLHFDGFGPGSAFKKTAGALSPTATVPILVDTDARDTFGDPLTIWDTLAITEYIAEYTDDAVWPKDTTGAFCPSPLCGATTATTAVISSTASTTSSQTRPSR